MQFYLGTHHPHWLACYDRPLMVSRRRLVKKKKLPRASHLWIRDSGGFTQLQIYGHWDDVPLKLFISEARIHIEEIGNIEYLAPRDWMCEPIIINGGWAGKIYFAGTKLSILEHQHKTVADYLDLREHAPELPWMPVLQGWTLDDYLRCTEMYDKAGINLATFPRVGVGSICRRQGTKETASILSRLECEGLKIHAFGLKGTGIPNVAPFLASSDSLAWSFAARRCPPLPECADELRRTGKGHKNCANCARFAFRWLDEIETKIKEYQSNPYQAILRF